MSAQNFNFAPKFFPNGGFCPKLHFAQKFSEKIFLQPPCQDVTGCTVAESRVMKASEASYKTVGVMIGSYSNMTKAKGFATSKVKNIEKIHSEVILCVFGQEQSSNNNLYYHIVTYQAVFT